MGRPGAAAAGHAVGGREAGAGQVPARPRRPRARGGRRESLRPRSARRRRRVVAGGTVRTGAVLMTRRVAAVDCGTNSLRLLVADVDLAPAQLTHVAPRMEILRRGPGVDQTGRPA